jgi:hypothetical protein
MGKANRHNLASSGKVRAGQAKSASKGKSRNVGKGKSGRAAMGMKDGVRKKA